MSAGLEIVDTMFSGSERVPWHGVGTVVEGALTAEEAIVAAGLNWEVEMNPIIQKIGESKYKTIPNMRSITRMTDERSLGIASKRYIPVQPLEGFEFMDELLESGGIEEGEILYETGGTLLGGQVIWLLARRPDTMSIAGEDIVPYVLFTNAFNAKRAIAVTATPIRVVCQNTLNWAISTAKSLYRVRHTGNVDQKLKEARAALEVTATYFEEFKESSERLALEPMTERMMEGILAELYPVEEGMSDRKVTNQEKVREAIRTVWLESPNLENIRDTKWGALNAVAEYSDWGRRVKNSRFDRIIGDTKLKQEAHRLLLAA